MSRGDDGDVLTGWKQIADYLDVSVRTAQNWEKTEALPVRRPVHSGTVIAYRPAIEAWRARSSPGSGVRWRRILWVLLAAVALTIFVWRGWSEFGFAPDVFRATFQDQRLQAFDHTDALLWDLDYPVSDMGGCRGLLPSHARCRRHGRWTPRSAGRRQSCSPRQGHGTASLSQT